jgi:hypothetical protein
MRHVSGRKAYPVLLSYAISPGSGKIFLQRILHVSDASVLARFYMIDEKALSAVLLDQVGSPGFCVIDIQKNLEMLPSVKSALAGYTCLWTGGNGKLRIEAYFTFDPALPQGSFC